MNKTIISGVFILFAKFLCVSSYAQESAALSLEWELLTNLHNSEYNAEAKFSLVNHNEVLKDDNWTIYFSMYPMNIKNKHDDATIGIEHINGDWFKIFPKKGFVLDKGDSLDFYYLGDEYNIKEIFGPSGGYIVYKDSNNQEKSIRKIEDIFIHPFHRSEQVLQSIDDQSTPYSSEKMYEKYEDLHLVNSDSLFPIVPTPFEYVVRKEKYPLPKNILLMCDSSLFFEADFLIKHAKEFADVSVKFTNDLKKAHVNLNIDKSIGLREPESYLLEINASGVHIVGYDAAGVFYGVQSFLSLLHFNEVHKKEQLTYMKIRDKPRFSFRSLHVDVARNFQTKETIFRILDAMAHYKLNNLLLYTSEDEGWRIEIPGLPELTEIGSKRLHPLNGVEDHGLIPSYGSGAISTPDNNGTGYYTKADFIDILKYAKERHINVIPELNFPGHARAAIIAMEKRYDRYIKTNDTVEANRYRLIDPRDSSKYLSPQFYRDNVVNISRESVYRFYLKVISEIDLMYQEAGLELRDVFVGGDEVAEGAWSQSPEVQKWAQERNVKNNHLALQAAFFKELLSHLDDKQYNLHGWEEIGISQTDSLFEPNLEFVGEKVIPYIWNNVFDYPDMGYRLANRGYEIVLCNVSNFYLDFAYNNNPKEPGHFWGGLNTTKDAWAFAPFHFQNTTFLNPFGQDLKLDEKNSEFEKLKDTARKNIKGVQAQLWAETIKGRNMLEYYVFPRLIGFAETAWGKQRSWEDISNRELRLKEMNKDWNYFANIIGQSEYSKLQKYNGGYHFRLPSVGVKEENGMIKANVEFPGLEIRYRVKSKPKEKFHKYSDPIQKENSLEFQSFVRN